MSLKLGSYWVDHEGHVTAGITVSEYHHDARRYDLETLDFVVRDGEVIHVEGHRLTFRDRDLISSGPLYFPDRRALALEADVLALYRSTYGEGGQP